jgi:hypothetical protein
MLINDDAPLKAGGLPKDKDVGAIGGLCGSRRRVGVRAAYRCPGLLRRLSRKALPRHRPPSLCRLLQQPQRPRRLTYYLMLHTRGNVCVAFEVHIQCNLDWGWERHIDSCAAGG